MSKNSGKSGNLRKKTGSGRKSGESSDMKQHPHNHLEYESLLEIIDGTVYSFSLDQNQKPLFYSQSILDLTGYTVEQFLAGKVKWMKLVLPEYRPTLAAHVEDAIEQKTNLDVEYEIKTAGGEILWIRDRGRATYDKTGTPEKFDGYLANITDRVLSNQRTAEKENELTTILESTGTMIAIIEPTGQIGYANSRFRAVTGYTPLELVGRYYYEFIPQSEMKWIRGLGQARLKGSTNIPNEYSQTLIHKSGHEISVFTTVSLLQGSKRQLISMVDLSSTQEAQSETRQQQERFEKFINSATEGFTLLDKNLNYLTVNKTALKYFPKMKKLNDIIGKNITEVIPDIKGTARLKAYKAVIKTGKPYNSTHLKLGKTFNYRHISMKAFKVGDGLGQVFEDITGRVETEEKIKVKTEQYRTLISNLKGMVYRCRNDKDWTMEFVSEGVKDLTGYNANDLINSKIISYNEIILPEYRDFLWEKWQENLAQKKYVNVEYQIRKKDGKVRWVHEKGIGVFNSEGTLSHLEGYIVDITKSRELQTSLEQSEKRFRNILESMSEGYFEADNAGKIVFCNDAFSRAFKKDPSTMFQKVLHRFFDNPSSQKLQAAMYEVAAKDTALVEILTIKNDRSTTVEISISPKHDNQGNLVGFKGVLINISDRQKADQLKNVVYHISEAAHTSSDLNQLYGKIHSELKKVMDASNLYFAYYEEETGLLSFPYYKDAVDSYPTVARPLGDGLTEYVIRNGEPVLFSKNDIIDLARKKKAKIIGSMPEQWMASPLKTDKKTVGVITMQSYTAKDLYNRSDLDMLNYISEQVAVTLERKVFETKLKSSEQKYKNLTAILDESNQFKELMMDIVGHDLKTPAGVIQGFSSLLYEDDPNNEIVSHIYESSKNLVNTFNDLTVLNKTFGTLKLPMKSQSLTSLVDSAIRDFQFLANENEMQIISKIRKDYNFKGNAILVEVFKNYISNAIKYASKGKKIIVSTKRKTNSIVVLVSDFGVSIPVKAREKIFLRSVQLQKSSVGGIGLGLAIVSRIAHLHGFKVWVESNKPTGNSFCIEIKLPKTKK